MTWDADQTALERSFTLSADDMQIVLGARGLAQRLERALMLTWMRVERELVSDVKTLPAPVIAYVAQQLELEPALLTDYVSYQQTRTMAAQDIREYLGVQPYTEAIGKRLQDMLVGKIAQTGHATALLQAAQDWLVEEGILRPPGEKTLETLVYAARTRGEEQLFAEIAAQLRSDQRARLDALCQTEEGISQLALFRRPPRKPSASSLVAECARLRAMRQVLVEEVAWGNITMNRLRQWAAIVRRLSAQALRRYPDQKRATLLLAFLAVRAEEVTNTIVEMFDQLVGRIFVRSDAEVEQTKVDRARFLQTSARHLRQVAEIITNEAIKDEAVRQELLRYLSPEGWAEHKTVYDAFERGEVEVLFSLLGRRFKHLREFAPTVLDTLSLSSPRDHHPLLEGLQTLATLGDKRGRAAQLPEDATTAFVPAKWKAAVTGKEGLDRKAWELTLMHEVRGALRSGDLTVGGSRRYAAWDTDLYSREAWLRRRAAWYREQELPEDGATYVAQLKAELHDVTRAVARALPHKTGIARIEGDRLIVTPLEALPVSAEVVQARAILARWLPHPGLPDLLQEVDRWTGFFRGLFPPGIASGPLRTTGTRDAACALCRPPCRRHQSGHCRAGPGVWDARRADPTRDGLVSAGGDGAGSHHSADPVSSQSPSDRKIRRWHDVFQ